MAKTKKAAEESDGAPKGGAPLFPDLGTEWSYLDITRTAPPEEVGFLGKMSLDSTEETIKGRFGGGTFIVRAKNDRHQVMNNRTIEIAGDPVFTSETARNRWLRGQGREKEIPGAAAPPAAAAQQFGVAEIVALFQGMQQMQMQQHAAAMAAQAEERRARDQETQRREDRQREEDRRREDERRAEEVRREERRAQEEERGRQRERDFMSTMINVVSAKQPQGEAGQMAAFTQGIAVALKVAGAGGGGRGRDDDDDDEEEPIGETVRGIVKGLGDTIAAKMGGGSSSSASSAPALPSVEPGQPEPVTFTGPMAAEVKAFVEEARAAGKNPENLIVGSLGVMRRKLKAPASSPPPPAAPATNGANLVAAAVNAVKANESKPAA